MKSHLPWILPLVFGGCSQQQTYHQPDSTYYLQQETAVLEAVSGDVMTHQFFVIPITKSNRISVYDSLAFPNRLQEGEVSRVMHDHQLAAAFLDVLRDTVNRSQSRRPVANLPISKLEKAVAFTPIYIPTQQVYIPTQQEAYPSYRLSRVVFNPDFTKAYFQLTWEDTGGGVRQYVICQHEGSQWLVKALDNWNSFKI